MYFAGSINRLFSTAEASGAFAQSLAARFDAAVAGLDSLILAWWDGSSDREHGGSAIIVDICLPARPKFTMQFAAPTKSFGGNTVLIETYGALRACAIIKRVLAYCRAENLLRDVVGELEIILVTDCKPVLGNLRKFPRNTDSAGRVEPVLDKIKALSEEIVGFNGASVKLDLYHCHRNMTLSMRRADELAGRARGQAMSFQCAIHHEDMGTRRTGDTVYFNNWERPSNTPSGRVLEAELQAALQRHPMKRKRSQLSDDSQTRKAKKRKISPPPTRGVKKHTISPPQARKTKKRIVSPPPPRPTMPLGPLRRSARLLAKASNP